MILFALFSWAILFYFALDRYTLLKNWLLKLVISFLFVSSLSTFLFPLSLALQLPYNLFELIFSISPILLLLFYFIFLRTNKVKESPPPYISNRVLILLFSSFIVFTVWFFNCTQRWGHWDAWAIWTMHAKFLVFEHNYSNLFAKETAWIHPDYPLMLSSIIAILWKSFQTKSAITPLLVSYTTCILILTTIITSFIEKKQLKKGLCCLLLLSCTNMLSKHGGSQYSDTLLSLFILLPFVLMTHLPPKGNNLLYFLIGFFAASSGWVKNEGLAFFLLFSIFFFLYNFRNKKAIVIYGLGCIIPLIFIGGFKVFYAPQNYLFAGQNESSYAKLFDFERHFITIKFFLHNLSTESPILLILAIISVIKFRFYKNFAFQVATALLLLYYFIYILTPLDLAWQLSCSFSRLVHQIMALLMYAIFFNLNINILKEP